MTIRSSNVGARHGKIEAESWVLLRTDWSKRTYTDYAGLRDDGAHTPGPEPAVVKWFVEERDVHGFGTETIGTDFGQGHHFNPPYPAHFYMHGKGRFGLQCLTNSTSAPKGAVTSRRRSDHHGRQPMRFLGWSRTA